MAAGIAAAPQKETLLNNEVHRLGNIANQLDGLSVRLSDLAERVFGPEATDPRPPNTTAPTPPAMSQCGQLQEQHDYIDRAIQRLVQVEKRLINI